MTPNGHSGAMTELEGRLDLQLVDVLETIFHLERGWRQEEHIDSAIRYMR